jgi:hypothetical protein
MNEIKQKAKPGSFAGLSSKTREPSTNGGIDVSSRKLTSLDGCPEVIGGGFALYDNPSLASLVGGPKEVGGFYTADHCGLISLEGLPGKIGGDLILSHNHLTSLLGINQLKEMDGWVNISKCPITSHILGVFFIKGCKGIIVNDSDAISTVARIVNQHISKGRAGLLACTNELIEAGLVDFSQI